MEIERPTMSDVDALVDLWLDLVEDQRSHGTYLRTEANRSTIRDTLSRHVVTGGAFVARDAEDRIVGFVTFDREATTYETTVDRGIVQNLYVRPDYRDDRIGTALLARAEAALAEGGAEAVVVETLADNEAARRFYDRRGYDEHRVRLEKRLEAENHSKDDG